MDRLAAAFRQRDVLDIKFLALSNAQIAAQLANRNIVYVYRSGYYRRLLKQRIRRALSGQGVIFIEADKSNLRFMLHTVPIWLTDHSIFSIVDFGTIQSKNWRLADTRGLLFEAISSENRLFLLVDADHTLTSDVHWSEFRTSAIVIEEPAVNETTFDAILSVLLNSHADIYNFQRLKNKAAFISSFKRRFTNGMPELPDLCNQFLYAALTQIDFDTDMALTCAPAATPVGRSGILARRLHDFLKQPDCVSLAIFVSVFDERCYKRGINRRALVAQLYIASGEIAGNDTLSARVRLAWIVTILAHEATLLTAPFTLMLDALAREWWARLARPEPTLGLWGALAETLSDRGLGEADRLVRSRDQLRNVLPGLIAATSVLGAHLQNTRLLEKVVKGSSRDEQIAALEPLVEQRVRELHAQGFGSREIGLRHWLARVKEGAEEQIFRLPDLDVPPPLAQISIAPVFRQFEDLPKSAFVTALLNSNKNRGDYSFLLLYGPEGAGKLAVARVFARAIDCERPAPSGSACLTCATCASNCLPFAELAYREFDLRNSRYDLIAKYLANISDTRSLSGKRIIVVLQSFELCQGHEFEALLHILENPPPSISFILTTTELHRVRPAIRSRARIVRIGPVPTDEMRSWLEGLCLAQGRGYEPRALDLIAAMHGGLARYSAETLLACGSRDGVTVARLLASDELYWQAGALAVWQAMLERNTVSAVKAVHVLAGATARKVEYLRAILAALQLWAADEGAPRRMGHYGLSLLKAAELDDLLASAGDCAVAGAVSLSSWFDTAVLYWLACDAREPIALDAYVAHFSEEGRSRVDTIS